jgi:hypothetical protein
LKSTVTICAGLFIQGVYLFKCKDGQVGISGIVAVMVIVIVATSLLPTISDAIGTYNGTGSGLLTNVPLFLVIGVLLAAVMGAGLSRMA